MFFFFGFDKKDDHQVGKCAIKRHKLVIKIDPSVMFVQFGNKDNSALNKNVSVFSQLPNTYSKSALKEFEQLPYMLL